MRMTLSHSILAALGALALASTTASALPAMTGAVPILALAQDHQPVQVQYYYGGPRRHYRGGPRYAYRGGYYRRGYRGDGVSCTATAETVGPTGVEMEALTAVQVALLTIYDMCKAIDRGMLITDVKVLEKHGGKSGSWVAGE